MRQQYEQLFLVLVALFMAALVGCNLIFQKFVEPLSVPSPLGGEGERWPIAFSVGLLPYPLTFLVTDLLSELYGRERANRVVFAGFFAALFATLMVVLAEAIPAAVWSPVQDADFSRVFGLAPLALASSMAAYLVAQLMDVRLFHFWRRLTGGRHLWLRNNASTIASQVVDTFLVIGLLTYFPLLFPGSGEGLPPERFWVLVATGILFKVTVAAVDTPLFYLGVWAARRRFAPLVDRAHGEAPPSS